VPQSGTRDGLVAALRIFLASSSAEALPLTAAACRRDLARLTGSDRGRAMARGVGQDWSTAIEEHVKTHGVTKCPPAAVEPTTAKLERNPDLRAHVDRQAEADRARNDPRVRQQARQAAPQPRPVERPRQASTPLMHSSERAAMRLVEPGAPTMAQAGSAAATQDAATRTAGKPAEGGEASATPLSRGTDPGPRPELAWIRIDQIVVDHRYQRPLHAGRAKHIARTFRWSKFQPLTVVPLAVDAARKDWTARFAAADGQHRLEGARLAGLPEVPCYIVAELAEMPAQAKAFVEINKGRAPVTNIDIYRAATAGGEPWAADLTRVLEATGVRVAEKLGEYKPLTCCAVRALKLSLERHGPEALRRCLAAIAAAWPKEAKAFREREILAVSRLFMRRPWITDASVTAFLRGMTPDTFERRVWQAAEDRGVEPSEALAEMIAERAAA
jgi:hypothetical protein